MSYPKMSADIPWSLVKNGFHKTPKFNSLVQPSASGRGTSGQSLQPFCSWDFSLDLNLVLGGESVQYSVLQKFIGCYMACGGRAVPFLFCDPNDNTVDDTGLSTPQSLMLAAPSGALIQTQTAGDGSTTTFQLARTMDQGIDILQQVSNVIVFVNGAAIDPATYSVSSVGVVTFTSAPAIGVALTWSGTFQYLCRFSDDSLKDLARVNKNSMGFLWSCGSVDFCSEFV